MTKNTNYETTALENEQAVRMRLECLMHGLSKYEDIEGLLFVREGDSIHVETNGEQLGGRLLITDNDPTGVIRWAKAKVELYTGLPSDEDGDDPEVMMA